MYFFTLKFSPMFLNVSAPLFLKVTVPSLLVTVLLCEEVDIFTVRPSGPNLSVVCGHNRFLVVDYLCQLLQANRIKGLIMNSINLKDQILTYNKYTVLAIS